MAIFNIPVTDYSNENSSVSLPVADAVLDADLTALFNAVDGICLGNLGQSTLNIATPKDAGPGGNSPDKFAHRHQKWLVRYHDAVTLEKHTLEIPCPENSLLTANTDFADLDAGAGATFKADFEANVISPRTGNAVILDSVQLVGRKFSRKKKK